MTGPTIDRPDATLGYQSPMASHDDEEWGALLRIVAYVGLATGVARVIWAWAYLPIGAGFEFGSLGSREPFPLFINGVAMALIGVGIVVASVATLLRKDWAPVLLLLNEQMAVILFAIITLTALSELYLHPNPGQQRTYLAAWELAVLVLNIGYPILAIAIFRTRAVRGWFREVVAMEELVDAVQAPGRDDPSNPPPTSL